MKKLFLLLLMFVILLGSGLAFAENQPEPATKVKEAIMVKFKVYASINGKVVSFSPQIKVLNKHKSEVNISDPDTKDKTFSNSISIVPEIVKGSNPLMINMQVKFIFKTKGTEFIRSFKTTVIDGMPCEFNSEDPAQKEVIRITLTAKKSQ
jgi:hypothetical protein